MPDACTHLIVYATTHGHTEKIARRIAARLAGWGTAVRVVNVHDAADLDVGSYATVIVGASIHAGHHQGNVKDWLVAHRDALGERPCAFFSVSLTAADDGEDARVATRATIDDFLQETGFAPKLAEPIAGALQYREYNVATRVLMRLVARTKGLETDADVDVDYTDWRAVDAYADRIVALAGRTAAVSGATS